MAVDRTDISEQLKDSYHALMLSYATGCLDQAQSLIVSSHVCMSEKAKSILRRYEMLGGALLEKDCTPVSMRKNSLNNVLDKLDGMPKTERECRSSDCFPEDIDLPNPIQQSLFAMRRAPKWKKVYPGFSTFELKMRCKDSKARFLKADPSVKTPHHQHNSTEITLVLDGAFEDGNGKYSKGDMIVIDNDIGHAPLACPKLGCVCLVVSSKPIKFTGFARILNPFLRT